MMLIANNVALSVVFCLLSIICLTALGFALRDVRPREETEDEEQRSGALCSVNYMLTGYAVFAGIALAVMIFFVGASVPAGWLWAFLVFAVITAIVMFAWALCNMDSVVGVILFIVSMILMYLLMHDVMIALKLSILWRVLALCVPIATIGFALARTLRDHGKYLMQESAGEKGHGRIMIATIIDIVTVILLIATILFAVIIPKQSNFGSGITDADIADVSGLSVAKVTDEDLMELELSTYPYSDKMLFSSIGVCDDSRVKKAGLSDAVTFPYESDDSEKMIVETEEEIFRNPIYGQMMAKGLKDKNPCGAKKTIGELNPWMDELLSKKWYDWCTKTTDPESGESTIRVTHEYRLLAATMCNLLKQFVVQGVQAHQTIENWRLNTPVAKDTDRDTMLAEYQYKKDALIFAYVPKNKAGSKELKDFFVFGLNIHDKRIEFYGDEDEPEITKTPSSEGGSNPGGSNPGSNPGGSNKPGSDNPQSSTEKPGSSPTEPGNPYNKDPNKAPKTDTEPNDDPGPGPNTNNGKGAQYSSEDRGTNSDHYTSYDDYKRDMQDYASINQSQKTGSDSNTPSTKSGTGTRVDNNGDSGTGYGGANTPTPRSDPEKTSGGGSITNNKDNPAGAWGGPAD